MNLFNRIKNAKLLAFMSSDASEVHIIGSASKILAKPEWNMPLSKCSFEGEQDTTFYEYVGYMVQYCGEYYMTLPPEEIHMVCINNVIIINDQTRRGRYNYVLPSLLYQRIVVYVVYDETATR